MTTFELEQPANQQSGRRGGVASLGGIWATVRRWHDRRRTLSRIAAMDEHLLRDAGFDPDDVRDALNGDGSALWEKWEKLHGAASRG